MSEANEYCGSISRSLSLFEDHTRTRESRECGTYYSVSPHCVTPTAIPTAAMHAPVIHNVHRMPRSPGRGGRGAIACIGFQVWISNNEPLFVRRTAAGGQRTFPVYGGYLYPNPTLSSL